MYYTLHYTLYYILHYTLHYTLYYTLHYTLYYILHDIWRIYVDPMVVSHIVLYVNSDSLYI